MRQMTCWGRAASPRSAARVNSIRYRPGSGALRFRPIRQPQSPADFLVRNAVVGLGQGGPRRLDVKAILDVLDQALEELEILDRDDRGGILPTPMDDDPFPLVLRPVQD